MDNDNWSSRSPEFKTMEKLIGHSNTTEQTEQCLEHFRQRKMALNKQTS